MRSTTLARMAWSPASGDPHGLAGPFDFLTDSLHSTVGVITTAAGQVLSVPNRWADSVLSNTMSLAAWAASDEGRAIIAALAAQQAGMLVHPSLTNAVAWLKFYGPLIAAAIVPGAGWALAAAYLLRGIMLGAKSLAELIGNVIVQIYPQAGPLVALVNARGEGLREMLLAGILSYMPAEVAPLVAFARNPRGALTEYALSVIPEQYRDLARSALVGNLKDAATSLILAQLPAGAAPLLAFARDPRTGLTDTVIANMPASAQLLARSALAGTLQQEATKMALGRMPPAVAAALALADDPRGTLTAMAIASLPADLQLIASQALNGDFDRNIFEETINSAPPLLQRLYGRDIDAGPRTFMAFSFLSEAAAYRSGTQWDQWRQTAMGMLPLVKQLNDAHEQLDTKYLELMSQRTAVWGNPAAKAHVLAQMAAVSDERSAVYGQILSAMAKVEDHVALAKSQIAQEEAAMAVALDALNKSLTDARAQVAQLGTQVATAQAQVDQQTSLASQAATQVQTLRQLLAQAQQQQVTITNQATAQVQGLQQQLTQATAGGVDAVNQAVAQARLDLGKALDLYRTADAARMTAQQAFASIQTLAQSQAATAALALSQAQAARITAEQNADQLTSTALVLRQQVTQAQAAADQAKNDLQAAQSGSQDLDQSRLQVTNVIASMNQIASDYAALQAQADQLRADAEKARQQALMAMDDLRSRLAAAISAQQQSISAKQAAEVATAQAQARIQVVEAEKIQMQMTIDDLTKKLAAAMSIQRAASPTSGTGGWLNVYTQGPASLRAAKKVA